MFRFSLFACLFAFGLMAPSAQAEVRFGDNVSIGGHDVSHQTFDRRHRGVFYLYDRQPPHAGCAWRRNGDGSRTKVCRYKLLH
jgi:hypothetical protein